MLDYKIIFGVGAVIVGLAGYPTYLRDIYLGKTKPHIFSWIVWTLIQGVAFFASLVAGGGAGAWFVGAAALACLLVTICAIYRGEKDITLFDWVSFSGALVGIGVWLLTSNPLWAVIIVTISDFFAFLPTIRKSISKPQEETLLNYILTAVANGMSVVAVQSYSITTWLYPASLVVSNTLFVTLALVRRSQLKYA